MAEKSKKQNEVDEALEGDIVESKPQKKKAVRKKVTKKKASKKAPKKVRDRIEGEEPRKPASFTSSKVRVKKGLNIKKFLVIVVIIVIVGFVAASALQTRQYGQESRDAATGIKEEVAGEVSKLREKLQFLADELEKQKEKKAEVVYNEYLNQQLGITFKYPESLGEVNEEIITQDADEDSDEESSEKVLHITFLGNPDIWLTAATSGYESEEAVIYNGSEENLAAKCYEPLAVTEQGYCDLLGILSMQTVEIVHPISDDTGLINTVKTIPINLSDSEYAGLTVNVGFGLPPIPSRNLFAPSDEEDSLGALEEFFRSLVKKEGLSLVVQENLKDFTTILTSLQILE